MATLRHEAVYREIIHPVLALLPPVIGGLAAASIFEDLLARDILTPLLIVAIVVAGVVETVIGNLVAAHRGGWEARLREFLLVSATAYLVLGVRDRVAGEELAAALAPRLTLIVGVVIVAGTWFAVHRRHAAFRPREDFLRSVRDRRGRELRHAMRETRGFATDILLRLHEANAAAAIGFVLLLIASTIVWASEQTLSLRSFALIVAYAPAALLTAAVIHAFRQEFAVYGEGIRVPNRYLRRLATAAGSFVIIALAVSLPFARNASPLSPAAVGQWLEGLRAWFASLPEPEMPDPRRFTLPPMEGFLGDYGISPRMLAFARFWETFARVFRTVALAVGGVLLVTFVVWPVFSRRFRRQVGAAHIGRRVAEYLLGIASLGLVVLRTLTRVGRQALRRVLQLLGAASGTRSEAAGDKAAADAGDRRHHRQLRQPDRGNADGG